MGDRTSGVIHPSEYPDINDDITNPAVTAEVEEDVNIEMHEDDLSFLAGQTKRTLHLSPIQFIQAPDGSLNCAALAGAGLAKEWRELRQQEQNDEADAEARNFNALWSDPMSKDSEQMFAQDLRGDLKGQKSKEVPQWKEVAFNKVTTYGEISMLSIQDQRKSSPIYKLRIPSCRLLLTYGHLAPFIGFSAHFCSTASGAGRRW
jgi:ATP-dependent RNA helicase DHX8/PRP22